MPVTFACFFIGALSIVGLPPTAGLWSKWYLGLATVEADELLILALLMLSSLLSLAYLLPIPLRAFFGKSRRAETVDGIAEAPWPILVATCTTSLACLVLFFFPDPFFDLLQPVLTR
jgi:multicomponent Na+:H+ antiporter subunit D